MKLLTDLSKLKKELQNSSRYIRSYIIKESISDFVKKSWLPLSENFKSDFDEEKFSKIEDNSQKLFKLSKRGFFEKSEALKYVELMESALEDIEFELIRKGSVIEIDEKKEIIEILIKNNFTETVRYAEKAELEFSQGKWKESCYQIRLSIEEFFRDIRERIFKKSVNRGTLGDHLEILEKQINFISFSERQLIQRGFYAFLSEKGDHANKEVVTPDDAKTSIYIFYILLEYVIGKLKNQKLLLDN